MSACNLLIKDESVRIQVDGLSYDDDGRITQVTQKCYALPTCHAAIASVGAGGAAMMFGMQLVQMFTSFDEIVAEAETVFPELYEQHHAALSACGFNDCEIFLAGWSAAKESPEAYAMLLHDEDAQSFWTASAKGTGYSAEPFKLQKLSGFIAQPPVTAEEAHAAGLTFDVPPERLIDILTETDMLHLLEIQRRQRHALRPGRGLRESHFVGGLALLTTVDKAGVGQKVVHRWDEDKVGEFVEPKHIDWKVWRASQTGAGLSRVKRQMAERKAKKLAA